MQKKTIGTGSHLTAYEAARARHAHLCRHLAPEWRSHVSQDFIPREDDAIGISLPKADPRAGAMGAAAPGGLPQYVPQMRPHQRG